MKLQTGSPFSIDTDDGSDRVNCTSNVVVAQPLFKTDFSGHSKTFQNNVDISGGGCGGSQVGTRDNTNIFTGNKCVGSGSPLACGSCARPGVTCPIIGDNMYYTAAAGAYDRSPSRPPITTPLPTPSNEPTNLCVSSPSTSCCFP
jgi:hypothetical protein